MVSWINIKLKGYSITFLLLLTTSFCHCQNDVDFFQDYYTLNPKHQKLIPFVGKWKTVIEYHSNDGVDYAKGNSSISLILNNRILEIKDSIISSSGIPFETRTYIGYDGIHKKYFLITFNSLTNSALILNGTYVEKQNQLIFEGKTEDPKKKTTLNVILKIIWERENKFCIEYSYKQKDKEALISKSMYVKLSQE